MWSHYFAADTKNETDDHALVHAFFLYEAFLLLSVPLWFVIGVGLLLLSKSSANWSRRIGKILFWLFVSILVILLISSEKIREAGSGEFNQTIPFFWHLIQGK